MVENSHCLTTTGMVALEGVSHIMIGLDRLRISLDHKQDSRK